MTGGCELAPDWVAAAPAAAECGFALWRYWAATDAVAWSPFAYRVLGCAPGEEPATGEALLALVHEEDREAARRVLRGAGPPGAPASLRWRGGKDVDWRRVRLTGRRDGEATVFGVWHDAGAACATGAAFPAAGCELRCAVTEAMRRASGLSFFRRDLRTGRFAWTPELYAEYGLDPDGFVPTVDAVRERVLPEDRARLAEAERMLLETGGPVVVRFRIRRPDGEVRVREAVSYLERDASGHPCATVGVSRDATRDVQLEDRLADQSRWLMEAGRVGGLGFWRRELDREDGYEWTEGMYRQLGLDPEDGPPTLPEFRAMILEEDRAAWDAARARRDASGETVAVDFRIRRRDGAIRRLRCVTGIEERRDGRRIAFGVHQDVTELIAEAERTARERLLLDEAERGLRFGWWRLDLAERRFEASAALLARLGLAQSATPSLATFLSKVAPEDVRALRRTALRVLRGGEAGEGTFRVLGTPERFWSTTLAAERGSDGTPRALFGITQDVTGLVEREREFERARRLAVLGQLTGGLAHDLNNILGAIGLNLDLLEDAATAAGEEEAWEAASQSLAKASRMARSLLGFARRTPLRARAVALAELFGEVSAVMRHALGPRRRLVVSAEPGLAALTDDARLESALVNLILNARDALPEGGEIALCAERSVFPSGPHAGEPAVRIEVRDGGVGMSAEVLARAGEPFFTTKGERGGSGLGLTMVRGFVDQSGGEMRIDSAPGCGTAVNLWLPAATSRAESGPQRREPERTSFAGLVALVADDEASMRAALSRHCEAFGLPAHAVADAEAALALLRAELPIHLLVVDWRLGGALDGPALAEAARRLRPDLGVVFVTGDEDAAANHGDPILRKPFGAREFLAALAEAASSRVAPARATA